MQYNSNPLLRSWVVVVLFWFTVGFFTTDASFSDYAPSLGRGIFVVAVGLTLGVLIQLVFRFWLRGNALWIANGDSRHGAEITLGRLPEAPTLLPKPPRRFFRRKVDTPSAMLPWYDAYAQRHPDYAAAFAAVFDALATNPDHPATVAATGHANLSLFAHSLGVVEAMAAVAPSWQYYGRRKRNGEISIPLSDPNLPFHSFAADDPLLPLAALAHDIGKLFSYQRGADGRYEEVRPTHGPEGAKILRAMPAVRQIPFADWTALLMAVKYYHNPGEMPQSSWATDRLRSLTELLLHADLEASRREGRIPAAPATAPTAPPVQPPPPAPVVASLPPTAQTVPVASSATESDAPEPLAPPDQAVTTPVEPAIPTNAPPTLVPPPATLPLVADDDSGPDPVDLAAAVLIQPNRLNGQNLQARIGFKFGDWMYVEEELLRKAIALSTKREEYKTTKAPGAPKLHSFTRALIEQLHARGMLRCPAGPFDPERALYKTRSEVEGKSNKEREGVLIIRTDAFPITKNIPDCKSAPAVVEQVATAAESVPNCDTVAVAQDTIAQTNNAPDLDTLKADVFRRICQGVLSKKIGSLTKSGAQGDKYAVIPVANLKELVPGFDPTNLPDGIRISRGEDDIEWAFMVFPTPQDAGLE